MKINWFGVSVLLVLTVLNGVFWAILQQCGIVTDGTLLSFLTGFMIGTLVDRGIGIVYFV